MPFDSTFFLPLSITICRCDNATVQCVSMNKCNFCKEWIFLFFLFFFSFNFLKKFSAFFEDKILFSVPDRDNFGSLWWNFSLCDIFYKIQTSFWFFVRWPQEFRLILLSHKFILVNVSNALKCKTILLIFICKFSQRKFVRKIFTIKKYKRELKI